MGLPAGLLETGYAELLRPMLFRAHGGDPEAIHEELIRFLAGPGSAAMARALVGLVAGSTGRPIRIAGIDFPNRVGLAAGLDKDASAVLAWAGLGFGFAELGTVTGRAQPGNERPRVFRAPASGGLVNRMGFNNPGAEAVAATLTARNVYRGNGVAGLPLGISIGKTKLVELADAVEDYLFSLRTLAPHADYIAVNVSSPNTPGLRSLQDGGALRELIGALVKETAERGFDRLSHRSATPDPTTIPEPVEGSDPRGFDKLSQRPSAAANLPIFVKVAPDLSFEQLDEVLAVCTETGAAGLIATNTTLSREGLAPSDAHLASEAGGLSGAPLTVRAREVVGYLARHTSLPIIGVGGIMTAADAMAMFDAGAQLVQLYTGFIYRGPGLISAINARDRERSR